MHTVATSSSKYAYYYNMHTMVSNSCKRIREKKNEKTSKNKRPLKYPSDYRFSLAFRLAQYSKSLEEVLHSFSHMF